MEAQLGLQVLQCSYSTNIILMYLEVPVNIYTYFEHSANLKNGNLSCVMCFYSNCILKLIYSGQGCH